MIYYFNSFIRGSILLFKLLIILIVFKIFDDNQVAQFSLITIGVPFFIYFLGLEYYRNNLRRIINKRKKIQSFLIKNQFCLYVFEYILISIFAIIIYIFSKNIIYLYLLPLIIFEHLNEEIGRILNNFNKIITTSILILLKYGLIFSILLFIVYYEIIEFNIYKYLQFYIFSSFIVLLFSIFYLFQLRINFFNSKLNIKFIFKKIIKSYYFIGICIFLNSFPFIERLIVNLYYSDSESKSYYFFSIIGTSLFTFIESFILVFEYNKISKTTNEKVLNNIYRNIYNEIIIISCIYFIFILLFIGEILSYLNLNIRANYFLISTLLLAYLIHAISYIYYYKLYFSKKESVIFGIFRNALILFSLLLFLVGGVAIELIPIILLISYIYILFKMDVDFKFIKILYPLFFIISFIFPRNKKIWVFGCIDGYTENSKYFFQYAHSLNKFKCIWLANNIVEKNLLIKDHYNVFLKDSLHGYWYSSRAYFTFISTSFSDSNRLLSLNSKIITFWHGTPIKKILLDSKYDLKNKFLSIRLSSFFLIELFKKIDFYFASNFFERDLICKASGIPKSKTAILGSPRHDIILDNTIKFDDNITILLRKFNKVILYSPTWRESNFDRKLFSLTFEERFLLESILVKNNFLLIVKKHPLTDSSDINQLNFHGLKNIVSNNIFDELDINILYKYVDVLITDISSAIFDFSLLGKPTILFMPDKNDYLSSSRGIYDYFYNELYFSSITHWKNLISVIEKNDYSNFNNKFFNINEIKLNVRQHIYNHLVLYFKL